MTPEERRTIDAVTMELFDPTGQVVQYNGRTYEVVCLYADYLWWVARDDGARLVMGIDMILQSIKDSA